MKEELMKLREEIQVQRDSVFNVINNLTVQIQEVKDKISHSNSNEKRIVAVSQLTSLTRTFEVI